MQAVTAIDVYFDKSIGNMKDRYKISTTKRDVAVNKISLTNPNVDIDKWYKGFKEDYHKILKYLILLKC